MKDLTIREVKVAKLDLEPGDVLIAQYDGVLTQEMAETLKAQLRELLPDERIRIGVVDGQMKLLTIPSLPRIRKQGKE